MKYLLNIHRLPVMILKHFWNIFPADVKFALKYSPIILVLIGLPGVWWVWWESHYLDHAFLWYLQCYDPRAWYETWEFYIALDEAGIYWFFVYFIFVWYIIIRDRRGCL